MDTMSSAVSTGGLVVYGGTGCCERCGAHLQPHTIQPPPVRITQPLASRHHSLGHLNQNRDIELGPLPPVPPPDMDDQDDSSLEGVPGLPDPPMQISPQHHFIGDHVQSQPQLSHLQHNQIPQHPPQQQVWQAHTAQMCYENGLLLDGEVVTARTLPRGSCDDLIIHPDRRSLATRTSQSQDSSAGSLTHTQSVELELSTTATHPSPSISQADVSIHKAVFTNILGLYLQVYHSHS